MKPKTRHYSHWYLLSLRGIFLILFGIYAISLPTNPIIKFVKVFELFTIVSGFLLVQNALLNKKQVNWQFVMFNGLFDLSFGIILWILPELDLLDLKIILAIWFLYSGLIQMVDSFILIHENIANWWFELISGMLSFVLAFTIIAVEIKMQEEVFIIVGVFALIFGVFLTATPIFLHNQKS